MSQENVEVANKVVDAFNRRDVEGFLRSLHRTSSGSQRWPGLSSAAATEAATGIEKYLVDIGHAWEEYRVLAEEFRDLDDRVVMLGRIEGRGRGSRAWIDSPTGTIFEFLNGKMSRVRTYLDHGEALRAAGLTK